LKRIDRGRNAWQSRTHCHCHGIDQALGLLQPACEKSPAAGAPCKAAVQRAALSFSIFSRRSGEISSFDSDVLSASCAAVAFWKSFQILPQTLIGFFLTAAGELAISTRRESLDGDGAKSHNRLQHFRELDLRELLLLRRFVVLFDLVERRDPGDEPIARRKTVRLKGRGAAQRSCEQQTGDQQEF
jgi:hypothetical protein